MTETESFDQTIIFCDGACSGNPGPGGWAAVIASMDGQILELGGGSPKTTNNQMELKATVEALRVLGDWPGPVTLYTDSVYVIKGITQWIWGWMRNNWKTSTGGEVSNQELWQELSREVASRKKFGELNWKYVRGHTGVPGNERCDEIAVAFSKRTFIQLYDGPLLGYGISIFDLPPDNGLPESQKTGTKKEPKKVAFSYVSLVGGTPMRHTAWSDCERRVKGQPGAKFKKSISASDESDILRSWGVDPSRLKS